MEVIALLAPHVLLLAAIANVGILFRVQSALVRCDTLLKIYVRNAPPVTYGALVIGLLLNTTLGATALILML